jgi:hypothetical protein
MRDDRGGIRLSEEEKSRKKRAGCAWRNRPTECCSGELREEEKRPSGDLAGQSSLADQASEGDEGIPSIGLEGQSLGAFHTKDGEAFEAPAFEGGIAAFDGIASAVIEGFPGWGTHGDIPHQADGAIGEMLGDVDDATDGVLVVLVRALLRRVERVGQGNEGLLTLQAGFGAHPLVALAGSFESIG